MLSGAATKFKVEVQKATNKNGRIIEGGIVGYIQGQKGSWKPLSKRYLEYKLKHGHSEQILIMQSILLRSVKYQKIDWSQGFVGVNRHEPKKNYDIGWIMEYGSRDGRVPARPYVEPSVELVRDKVAKNYEDAVDRVFK